MTKSTSASKWRAERFRSTDVRRSVHQRATKYARKRYREPGSVSNSASAEEKPLPFWKNLFVSFIGATIFSFLIFGISFIAFDAEQAAKGSSYFPTSDFVVTIGTALVAWLVAFVAIWYC